MAARTGSRALRRLMAAPTPARAVAPVTPAAATGGAGAASGGAPTREVSPELQKYLATQAYPFGEKPLPGGAKRPWEHWEASMYVMLAALVAVPFLSNAVPNNSMQDWARDEAEERIRRRVQGLPVEFGKNYAALRALEEAGYDVSEARGGQ